ncbi:MAG: SAM-dependent methyltransferase [Cyclonatronaceae bacterium]
MPETGILYLVPTPLGPHPRNQVLPGHVIDIVHHLDTFFVERIRQAISFLRWIEHPLPDFKCRFYELNKHTPGEDLIEMLSILKNGGTAGILTEAGCPGVADPGSDLVRLAHESDVRVIPLVGPSSILLAIMASGMNGQAFAFHGYLPRPGREQTERIRSLERESSRRHTTQVFMETPYRNNELMKELLRELADDTRLCVASNLTLPDEQIISCRVAVWKKREWNLDRRPAIFLILAGGEGGGGRPHGSGRIKNSPGKKKPARRRKQAGK